MCVGGMVLAVQDSNIGLVSCTPLQAGIDLILCKVGPGDNGAATHCYVGQGMMTAGLYNDS